MCDGFQTYAQSYLSGRIPGFEILWILLAELEKHDEKTGVVMRIKGVVMWFGFFGFLVGCVRVCMHVFSGFYLCVDGSDVLGDLLADGPIGITGTNEGEVSRPALLASTAIQEGGAHGAAEPTLLDVSEAGILDETLDFEGHVKERVVESPVRVVVADNILAMLFYTLVPASGCGP